MKAWRRTEPRTARPFFAVNSLGSELKNAVILVGDREHEIQEDSVQLDPTDFEDLHVSIAHRVNLNRVRQTLGEKTESFSLMLTIRDPMFKRRVIHKSWPLTTDVPDELPLTKEIVEHFGHKRELHVTIALALTRPLEPEQGWPQHHGSWITKRTFKIKLRSIRSTFDLRPMSPDKAKSWTGYSGALIFTEVSSELLGEELSDDQSLATVYIAQEIYEAMQRATDGPLLQNLIIAEVVSAILTEATEEIQDLKEAPKGTPIATILEQLGDSAPMTLKELKVIAKDPIKLRALVHDRTDFVKWLRTV